MFETEFKEYSKNINLKLEDATEYTYRSDLENLLNVIKPNNNILIVNEGNKDTEVILKRKPDLKIKKDSTILGYIETKPLNADLDAIIQGTAGRNSEQFQDNLEQISNFILTDYNTFIRFKEGIEVERCKILDKNNVIIKDQIEKILNLLDNFFSFIPEPIKTPKKLAELLAKRAHRFKEDLTIYLDTNVVDDFKDRLIGTGGLYDLYKETLIKNLKLEDFVDVYVQTITYGLFLARLNSNDVLTLENAWKTIPKSIGIIRELFETIKLDTIPNEISWIIDDMITILNSIDEIALKKNLSFSGSYKDTDPYIYFYENFLKEYNPTEKKLKGVYYTPIPIVNFIVKSIDKLIREKFDNNGLKSSDVTVLDFASGTGTFLQEAFKYVLQNVDEGLKNSIINERLLKNYYGFEILIAPYTISHLRLSQFLKEVGYKSDDGEKLKVYLTDTLDNTKHTLHSLFHEISREGNEANEVKIKKNVLAVMGNPPYSNFSDGEEPENNEWIKRLLKDYKDDGERKQNLNDKYIKFLRYAQWKIEKNGHGIIGVITNNSFIDGISRKMMRKSLLKTFDEIYILNLHGHYLTDPPEDKNVFDIEMGVCISFFVKLKEPSPNKQVLYYSTLENNILTRNEKYDLLLNSDISKLNWYNVEPKEPSYYFLKRDLKLEDEYNEGWSLTDIFEEYGSGFKTERDHINVHFTKEELLSVINDFINLKESEIRSKYDTYDSRDWTISGAQKDVQTNFPKCKEKLIKNVSYRPFDDRVIYYSGQSKGFMGTPQKKIGSNFIDQKNLGLVSVRQVAENKGFNHVFITEKLTDVRMISSSRGTCYVFPLYINKTGTDVQSSLTSTLTPIKSYKTDYPTNNFSEDFIKFITHKYPSIPSPEDILCYIYAILHSRTYRERYNEFLKRDYPKIHFPEKIEQFKTLSEFGYQLKDVHLLNTNILDHKLAKYPIDGTHLINDVKYDDKKHRIYINDSQYFDNIPNEVWKIEICGYNVLKKWLKYREGRKLSLNEIEHFQKVVNALNETIKVMDDIDKIY